MKYSALTLALGSMAAIIAAAMAADAQKPMSPRGKAPEGWTKFEWPQKKEVLNGLYAPTDAEKGFISAALPAKPTSKPAKSRRVLNFYRCVYPHSSIATGNHTFEALGAKTNAYTLETTDEPTAFTPSNLANYDAVMLNNSVGFENFLDESQRSAILDFVKSGKGLIAVHGGGDSCNKWPEGAQMIGGIFECHPWTSGGTWAFNLESPEHPLNAAFKADGFYFNDEIYRYKPNTFSTARSRVLVGLDMTKARNVEGRGMSRELKHLATAEGDHPAAWIHKYGEGRVFYSNFGHNHTTYWDTTILRHWLDGIQFALGDLTVDTRPSAALTATVVPAPAKRIYFLAGKPSHASGAHEFRAGCMLLAKALNAQTDLPVQAEVISGWPADDKVLDGAAALVIYCDADSVHRDQYARLMELSGKGTGVFFMHYGVHPDPENGKKHYMPTVGGYMETGFSVNPHWVADLTAAENHPIRRGCEKPIPSYDEYYYSLRFDPAAIDLATGIPTKENMVEGSNLWNDNATANYGKPQRLMWGFQKQDGTRGGGFVGGHYHRNWAIDDYRRLVLNAVVWIAGMEVPEGGIKTPSLTEADINANLDAKKTVETITLPLKNPMDYRASELERRAERAAEKATKDAKKADTPAPATPGKQAAADGWRYLLDKDLSQWESWIGIPHKTVQIPGIPTSLSENGINNGTPLGLNNDPLKIFTTREENGTPILAVTGQIYGGLTTKEDFENYHLSLEFKWGEKKWEPRLTRQRDSGLLVHCVGRHGAFWNVWMRSLECQIQEYDVGDFFALAGTEADIPSVMIPEAKRSRYQLGAALLPVRNSAQRSENYEKPTGEWNTVEVYTVGDRTIHVVNGKLNMVLLNTREFQGETTKPLTKGKIQLQSEGAEVYYRDVKLRPLAAFPETFKSALP